MKSLLTLLLVSTFSYYLVAEKVYENVNFSYKNIDEIYIDASFCDVIVTGGNSDDLNFEGLIEGVSSKNNYRIIHEKSGGTLKIWVESTSANWKMNRIKGELKIDLGAIKKVDIKSSSGNINAQNIEAISFDVRSSSGDIFLTGIAANLNARSTSGKIISKNIQGRTVQFISTSGNIQLSEIVNQVKIVSTSGSIRITQATGDSEIKTTSGSISLSDYKGKIRVVTTSGKISADNSEIAIDARTTSGDIRLNNSTLTGNAFLTTSSGDISAAFTNDKSEVQYDLKSSSGKLNAAGSSAKGTLKAGTGQIVIHGQSSSGSQDYY